jgi:hypothetical protein
VSTSRTSSLTSIGTFSSLPAHWFQALVGLWRIRSGRWEPAFHRLVAKTRGRAFIAICFKSWTKGGDVVGSFVNAAADAAGGTCLEARGLSPWLCAKCISSGRWSARPSVTSSNAAADPNLRVKIRESAALTGACLSQKRG